VCVSAALVSTAKVMRCIQCSLVVVVDDDNNDDDVDDDDVGKYTVSQKGPTLSLSAKNYENRLTFVTVGSEVKVVLFDT